MYTLIKFKACWADEFDCEEFLVVEDDIDEIKSFFKRVLDPKTDLDQSGWYFGTNQGWENEDIDISAFSFEKISKEEANTLKKLLTNGKDRSFGLGIISMILEADIDDDEDDEDDDDE